MKTKNHINKRFSVLGLVLGIILSLYAMSILYALFWAGLTSFKSVDEFEFFKNYLGFPQSTIFLENYKTVLDNMYLTTVSLQGSSDPIYVTDMLFNSLFYVFGASIIAMLIPCITAYLNYRFGGKLAIIMDSIVVVTMALPVVGTYPSEISLLNRLNLYNSFLGLFLMKASFLGVYYLIFMAAFRSLGMEYAEAASIDGASEFRIMVQVMLPLVGATMFTIFLLLVITHWNDYQAPMLYMPHKVTLSYGLYVLSSTGNVGDGNVGLKHVPYIMAAVIMVILPMLILFIVFRKKILSNQNIGGLKE